MRQARYAASQGSCPGLYLVWWLGHMALRPVAMYKCTSDSNKAVFINWQELCDFVTGLFFDQLSLAENLENFKLTAVMRPNRWKRCKINQTKERTNEHTKERRSKQANKQENKQTIKQASKQTLSIFFTCKPCKLLRRKQICISTNMLLKHQTKKSFVYMYCFWINNKSFNNSQQV